MQVTTKEIKKREKEIVLEIIELEARIADLKEERHRLYVNMQNLDMDLVLQFISEKGMTSQEVLSVLNDYRKSRKAQRGVPLYLRQAAGLLEENAV